MTNALASPPPYRLNVGCGKNPIGGWINLDAAAREMIVTPRIGIMLVQP